MITGAALAGTTAALPTAAHAADRGSAAAGMDAHGHGAAPPGPWSSVTYVPSARRPRWT